MARKVVDRRTAGCWARPLRVTVRVVVPILFIGLLWYLHSSAVTIAYVPSGSMEPTLLSKDRILIRLDAYNSHGPERGDIIVYVGSDGRHYVKRVIGIAGETLTVASGRVWINRQGLDEPYIKKDYPVAEPRVTCKVAPEEVFVLGDNRNFSADSRDFGTIPVDAILGKATHIIWPRDRARRLEPAHYE